MAKKATNRFKPFNLEEAPVVAENERILESTPTKAQAGQGEQTETVQTIPTTEEVHATQVAQQQVPQIEHSIMTASLATAKSKKASNGIVVDVPMPLYIELSRIKIETGRSLKDLAQQAIKEFVERYKIG